MASVPLVTAYMEGYVSGRDAADMVLGSTIEELDHDATHHPVSGLLNGRGFERRIARMRAENPDKRIGIVAADLTSFKAVNDTYGHKFGDEVLRLVGDQFRAGDAVGGYGDTLGHDGGDEFKVGVVLNIRDDTTDPNLTDEVRLRSVVDRTRSIGDVLGKKDPRLAAVGFALAAGGAIMAHGETLSTTKELADKAMYADKQLRKKTLTPEQAENLRIANQYLTLSGVPLRDVPKYITELEA